MFSIFFFRDSNDFKEVKSASLGLPQQSYRHCWFLRCVRSVLWLHVGVDKVGKENGFSRLWSPSNSETTVPESAPGLRFQTADVKFQKQKGFEMFAHNINTADKVDKYTYLEAGGKGFKKITEARCCCPCCTFHQTQPIHNSWVQRWADIKCNKPEALSHIQTGVSQFSMHPVLTSKHTPVG